MNAMTRLLGMAMMAVAMAGCGNPDTGLGSTGEQGPKGATGAQGPKGDRGPQGPAGEVGPQGPMGERGAQGASGPAGAQGPQGDTGAAGPKGATGAQGPMGLQGPQGPQGPQGAVGATGAQGPKGAAGADGATGPAGAQGAAGPIGPQGPAGADGAGPIQRTDVYTVTNTATVTLNQTGSIDATCLPGDVLLSGSCDLNGGMPVAFYMSQSTPYISGSHSWKCSGANPNAVAVTLRATALCYNAP